MYQALYRKWRPGKFSEVSGQPQVTLTLLNELKGGRVSHAYLFTGSRGTGKTSCAKILAKAVNCENPVDGEPCGQCELCRMADDGSAPDIYEIDAASNNGVDNIRDIREEVNITPLRGKYRVYIIDEVHMLSQGAFNALLKTLEEPPAHVIFILATTEVHKLPATVLSRCQRFDFKRISPEDISARLIQIAEGEGVKITADAAALIARLADGGMRDAVSLLDRCCARGTDIDSSVVSSAAGIAGTRHLFEMSGYISKGDTPACISLVNTLHREACDIESLCTELTVHYRNLMIAKTVKNCADLIIVSADELNELKQRASEYKLSKILACLDILQETGKSIKGAVNKKILLESAVIRMCSPALSASDNVLNQRISELEKEIENLKKMISGGAVKIEKSPAPAVKEETPAEKPEAPAEESPAPVKNNEPETFSEEANEKAEESASPEPQQEAENGDFTLWQNAVDLLQKNDMPLYMMLKDTSATVINGESLIIHTDNVLLHQFIMGESHARELMIAIHQVTGKKYKLKIDDKTAKKEKAKNPLEDLKNKINQFNS